MSTQTMDCNDVVRFHFDTNGAQYFNHVFFYVLVAQTLWYIAEFDIILSSILVKITNITFQFEEFIKHLIVDFSKIPHSFFNILLFKIKPVSQVLNSPNSFSRIVNLSISKVESFTESLADIPGK